MRRNQKYKRRRKLRSLIRLCVKSERPASHIAGFILSTCSVPPADVLKKCFSAEFVSNRPVKLEIQLSAALRAIRTGWSLPVLVIPEYPLRYITVDVRIP